MRRSLKIFAGFAATVVLMAGAQSVMAQAWTGAARIKGVVTDLQDNPIKGAKVTYRMMEDRDIGPAPLFTDKKGRYARLGLRGGTWLVTVEADGYERWQGPSEIYSHAAPEVLHVKMKELPKEVLRAEKQFHAQEKLDKGKELMAKGDIEGAQKLYYKALDDVEDVDKPVIYNVLANSYLAQGNTAKAEEILRKSLELNPDNVSCLKSLCGIVASQGKVEEAEELLKKIPESESLHQNTTMNLGMAHYNKGEMDIAKKYLDKTVQDHPDVAQAYYFRGLINLSLDQSAAKADFEKFIEMAPDSPQAAEARDYLKYLNGSTAQGEQGQQGQ